jgi:hypothetical protein
MMNSFTRQFYMATSPAGAPASEDDAHIPSWSSFLFGSYKTHHFMEHAIERAPKEVGCALAASLLVSPLVSIIDKCIVQDISGTEQFMKAITGAAKEMVFTPRKFFGGLSFRLTAIVYFGTYAVANLSELVLDVNRIEGDQERKSMKVAASSVANIGLLAWRDSVFAREFSAATPKHATPMRTLGLFAARDASTMYATFYAAPAAAEYLQDEYGVERYTAELSMALAIPVATQVVTAPLHIHAMDFYAKPDATTAERLAAIKKEFPTVSFARGFRILPAFGIGSFSNNRFREYLIRHDWDPEPLPLKKRITNMLPRKLTEKLNLSDD